MALEKSVLDYKTVFLLLRQYYGITPVDVQKLKLGSANCYRVFDGTNNYFLKEFQSSFSESKVIQEAMILEFLRNTDIPVARFYRTLDGSVTFRFQDRIICLEEFIEGQSYGYDDLPIYLLPQVGRMLGKLHCSLRSYSLPVDMSEEWLTSFSVEKTIAQYDYLIELARSKRGDKNIGHIIDDLQFKKQLASRCEGYKKHYQGITYCATHGDYQACQLIFEGDNIKAVIDFSSASSLPVTWEIMRSFVQSSEQCRDSASVDIQALCAYVREYMKFSPLTKKDLVSMPYVYLFQIARSKFGYPQYLNSDSEDREGLLQFAFWRTQMCREVERKADVISAELLKLIEHT